MKAPLFTLVISDKVKRKWHYWIYSHKTGSQENDCIDDSNDPFVQW